MMDGQTDMEVEIGSYVFRWNGTQNFLRLFLETGNLGSVKKYGAHSLGIPGAYEQWVQLNVSPSNI